MNQFPFTHILTLSGSPRQRGQIHGEALRAEIRELMQRYKDWLAFEHGLPAGEYIRDLVSQTGFIPAIERWTPGLLDEVRGMAEGAGVDFDELFVYQLQDEEWWFGEDRRRARTDEPDHCTAIGWRTSAGALVAQNMDMPGYLDGFQAVLRIRYPESELEALVFTTAGLLALNGMNNAPLGVVCNNLGRLKHASDGLPVAFVNRGILERQSLSAAVAFLKQIRHASGQNYLLGGGGQVADLECSANQVVELTPRGSWVYQCHTNHPLVSADFPAGTGPADAAPNSLTRFAVMDGRLSGMRAAPEEAAAARELLSSHESEEHPVCRHPGSGVMTVGASIMMLDAAPRLEVCPGPPCCSTFSCFNLA